MQFIIQNSIKKKIPSLMKGWKDKKNLAATYSPADELQYHRREGVLLPCSGWERVSPPCYGHQEIMQKCIPMIIPGTGTIIWPSLTEH